MHTSPSMADHDRPDGLGDLRSLPYELRALIWKHMALPRVLSRPVKQSKMPESSNRASWWPLWRVSKALSDEFMPMLYDRAIVLRPHADFQEFEVGTFAFEDDSKEMFLAFIKTNLFPFAAKDDKETCRYLNVPWSRFNAIKIELRGAPRFSFNNVAHSYFAYS